MPLYVPSPDAPQPSYRINVPLFLVGAAIVIAGIYLMSTVDYFFPGLFVMIVGGVVAAYSRRLPPGWRG